MDQTMLAPAIAVGANTVADDRLRGVTQIAEFIGENYRTTVYLLTTKRIPAGKQGKSWLASRQLLREHYARLASGEGDAQK
jgi:hypothetical protein